MATQASNPTHNPHSSVLQHGPTVHHRESQNLRHLIKYRSVWLTFSTQSGSAANCPFTQSLPSDHQGLMSAGISTISGPTPRTLQKEATASQLYASSGKPKCSSRNWGSLVTSRSKELRKLSTTMRSSQRLHLSWGISGAAQSPFERVLDVVASAADTYYPIG